MKLISKFFVLAFIASFFVSCGGDKMPASGQVSTSFNIIYGIAASADPAPLTITSQSTPNATINLTDVLTPSGNSDKAKYVSGSVLSNASSIAITGINAGATLSNITFDDGVSVKGVVLNDHFSGKPLVLSKDTTITAMDTNYANFLTLVGNDLASKKNITLKATYTVANQTTTTGKISLTIATTFGW